MKISISGGTREQQSLCRNFAKYTLPNLIVDSNLVADITVTLRLEPTLHHLHGILGDIDQADNEYNEFDIEIDSCMKPRHLLTTLAHELVHLKQLATHELKYLLNGSTKWKMQVYQDQTEESNQRVRLTRQPWEIEAAGLENTLFVEWAESQHVAKDWMHVDVFV